uniref:ZP domain-containing protein n=1 Tax=Meloidogyne hapla TaxID=6305 RepID=A0A1I8BWQ1_MELHA
MFINYSFNYLINFIFILFIIFKQQIFVESRLLDTSVACDQHNFMLSLNFDVPFHGLVYSEEGLPNCIYVNGTMLSQLNYHLKVPLNGCETKINSDGNFENGVIIQENIAFLQASDKKYLLTCIPSSPLITSSILTTAGSVTLTTPLSSLSPFTYPISSKAATTTTIAFGEENESITVDLNEISSNPKEYSLLNTQLPSMDEPIINNNTPSELKYSVEIKNGHNFEDFSLENNLMGVGSLNIGDPISYLVRIQKPVSDSQIGRCWATDSNSSLELSDERGCSVQPKEITRQRRNDENINGILEEIETLKVYFKLIRQKRNIQNPLICQKEIINKTENWWCISLKEMFIVCLCCGLISILIGGITSYIVFTKINKINSKNGDEIKTENIWSFLEGIKKENNKEKQLSLSRYFV